MSDNTSPDSPIQLAETYDLIGRTTLSGAFYGATFVLYCLSARSWYLRLQKEPEQRKYILFSLGLATIILAVAIAMTITGTRKIQLAYIKHSEDPHSYKGSLSSNMAPDNLVTVTIDSVLGLVIAALTQGVQVWRLWTIWHGTRFRIILGVLALLFWSSYIGLFIVLNFVPRLALHANAIILDGGHAILSSLSIIDLGLNGCLTVFVTIMITIRLVLVRRNHLRATGSMVSKDAGQYLGIIAVLVESYALETIWAAVYLIFALVSNPAVVIINRPSLQVQVAAYFLVVYRISSGCAWNTQTEHQLNSLRQQDHNAQLINPQQQDRSAQPISLQFEQDRGTQFGGSDVKGTSWTTRLPNATTTQVNLSLQSLPLAV